MKGWNPRGGVNINHPSSERCADAALVSAFGVNCHVSRDIRNLYRRSAPACIAAAVAGFALAVPAAAQSALSVGPRGVQTLVVEQLFDRGGRWYLIDDGGCYSYLESPFIRLVQGRLVLHAHLSSRLGQPVGNGCEGADFASNVTLSGRLLGRGHLLILDDIRIDRIDDAATRNAFNLALQLDPQIMPHVAKLDVSAFVRQEVVATGGSRTRLDGFRILSVATRADAVVIRFDLSLSVP